MPFRERYYTHRRSTVTFADPTDPSVFTLAWQRATQWRATSDPIEEALADIAAHCDLASGLAARDALLYYAAHYYGFEGTPEYEERLARYARDMLGWPRGCLDSDHFLPDEDNYIRPIAGEPTHHPEGCECRGCNPCTCNGAHCADCHPDGPPSWCECRLCRPAQMDDQEDDDDWEPPEPVTPEGRCRFGIEIEFNNGDRRRIAQEVQNAGIACTTTDYSHEIVRYWKMTTDASVSGGELVSPIMSGDDHSIEQTRHAIRIVKEHGGQTARNVGMHVHLDVTTFTREQLLALAHNLQRGQKFLAGFVPPHRYDGSNSYGAALLRDNDWTRLTDWLRIVDLSARTQNRENRTNGCPINRYVAFNFNSLMTYGTVECRLLGHTLNTIKVRTWIRTLQAIVEASRLEQRMPRGDILAWLSEFGLEQEHADHFRQVVTSRSQQRYLVAA